MTEIIMKSCHDSASASSRDQTIALAETWRAWDDSPNVQYGLSPDLVQVSYKPIVKEKSSPDHSKIFVKTQTSAYQAVTF